MAGAAGGTVGGAAMAGRIPIARDVNAYGESRTRDLYYAFLDQRKRLAKHGIRLRFDKPVDHPDRCVVFDLGYGVVEVKWSDTYGYYRYFYGYEYSNSGTRKIEKVMLREQLGRTADEAKANLLGRLDDGAFSNGYREVRKATRRRSPLWLVAAVGLTLALGACGGALVYFLQ